MKLIDLAGRTFGRLTVLRRDAGRAGVRAFWIVRCACGNERSVGGDSLTRGNTESCGCLQVDRATQAATRHGGYASPEHRSWQSMLERCRNPKSKTYAYYGGRGIIVCERWQGESGFENFVADMGPRPSGKTLERKDTNGNYDPENCKWATGIEQGRNQRSNRLITFRGETLNVSAWAERLVVPVSRILSRLHRGWSERDALAKPARGSLA